MSQLNTRLAIMHIAIFCAFFTLGIFAGKNDWLYQTELTRPMIYSLHTPEKILNFPCREKVRITNREERFPFYCVQEFTISRGWRSIYCFEDKSDATELCQ